MPYTDLRYPLPEAKKTKKTQPQTHHRAPSMCYNSHSDLLLLLLYRADVIYQKALIVSSIQSTFSKMDWLVNMYHVKVYCGFLVFSQKWGSFLVIYHGVHFYSDSDRWCDFKLFYLELKDQICIEVFLGSSSANFLFVSMSGEVVWTFKCCKVINNIDNNNINLFEDGLIPFLSMFGYYLFPMSSDDSSVPCFSCSCLLLCSWFKIAK